MNAIKHKSMELKNRFDTLFYDPECDSADYKSESKDLRQTTRSMEVLCDFDNNTCCLFRGQGMEIVLDPMRSDHGKEMLAVVPFSDIAFVTNNAYDVFHILGVAGRQRLAGLERLAGSGSRTSGK